MAMLRRFRSSLATILLLVATSSAHAQPCGDPDGSGRIDVTDGVLVLRAAAGLATPCTLSTCDLDGDGRTGVADGVNALRAAAGLPVAFTCPVEGPTPRECVDLSGRWEVYEEIAVTCRVAGEEQSTSGEGSGIVDIHQDDCTISYRIPGFDVLRTGTVEGNTVTMRGPFAFGNLDQLDVDRNEATGTGTLDGDRLVFEGHGVLEGTVQGWDFRCTGESVAVFTRVGSAAALDEAPLAFPTRELELFGGLLGGFAVAR